MTTISRRALLSMLPPVLAAPLLADCAGLSVSQISSDVDMIAKGIEAILPLIKSITGISQSTVDKVTSVVDEIKAVVSDISSGTKTTTIGLVKKLGTGVSKIVDLLGGVTLPSWVSTVLEAAGTLIPTIEKTLGFTAAASVRAASAMTAEQARAILAAAAAK